MKKVLALALVAIMVLALCGAAFAAGDANVQITGLTAGDKVYLYNVLAWDNYEGWVLQSGFTALNDSASAFYSENIHKIVSGDKTYNKELTKADVEKIAKLAKDATALNTSGTTVSGTTFTYDTPVWGMYIASVVPADKATVYNPIIVSSDFTAGGNTIDTSDKIGTPTASSVVKKKTITLEKTTEDPTLDLGEPVKFTIETTIPAYSNAYTDPTFELHDKMSTGLVLVSDASHTFKVTTTPSIAYEVTQNAASGNNQTVEDGKDEFTVKFNSADILAKAQEISVKIEYYAKITGTAPLNVNEETNDVEVKFSNDWDTTTGHSHLYDKVKEYTFTIDGNLLGDESWHNSEVVKVGLNADGSIALSEKTLSNGHKVSALQGVKFGLYNNKADADAMNENYYKNSSFDGTVLTDENGRMTINGLDEGTYWLRELDAPDGWIMDNKSHKVEIEVTGWEDVTETTTAPDGCPVKYTVRVLKSYTVKVDGKTSSYSMTLNGPSVSKSSPSDSSSDIVNTKGLELPSTGGIGTTIFYVAGLIMVLGASIILVSRRRADAE